MITLIGNSLNSNNKKVLDKMNKMDFEFVKREVVAQIRNGAEFIELNADCLKENEFVFLKEAVNIIEGVGGKVLVRSRNIEILVEVAKITKNELVIGNIEYNKEKIDYLLEKTFSKNGKVKIIATIKEKDQKESCSPEKSLLIAQMYIDYLLDNGITRDRILLDPVLRPLEEDISNGKLFLDTLELFKLVFPQIKTIANLSALSEGLPMRELISCHFVSLAIEKG